MNSKKYKIILFDLDGTLNDSKIGITKSVQYALKYFGIDEKNLDSLEKFVGPPLKESFMTYYNFDESTTKLAIEKYREYYTATGIYENTVYPGIKELLEKLQLEGKKLIVATSKPTVFAEKVLKNDGTFKYFEEVIGSNLDGSRSVKSEIISHIISDDINKNDVVMIGDRKYDIIGAQEVGIDSIGVLYGYGSREELEKAKPSYIVDSVLSLEKMLLSSF